jgi:hypothetical protein
MVCLELATPGTEACDAVGGAFRREWREGPVAKVFECDPMLALAHSRTQKGIVAQRNIADEYALGQIEKERKDFLGVSRWISLLRWSRRV